LIDLNNAPASALGRLPGVDEALATRIIEGRAEAGGFSSVEELGATLELDAPTVEALRDVAVFLPRTAPAGAAGAAAPRFQLLRRPNFCCRRR
jgi:hypothetical protein